MSAAELQELDHFLHNALDEDVGTGDVTSLACIPASSVSTARLLIKDPGVLAGMRVAQRLFHLVDPESSFSAFLRDGQSISIGDVAFEVRCNTRSLLQAERICLNLMQRMSGIATLANRFAFEVEDLPVKLLDTRKTTPLLRFLEKEAVKLGGCYNYRSGLYDWFMIKDNHIEACGGVQQAIHQVLAYKEAHGLHQSITVEVRNLVELYGALEVGRIDRVMLDNFELPLLKEAVDIIGKRFESEASGGVTIHNVRAIALTGVDFISIGALTHSAQSLDMSLKIVREA